MLVSRFRTPIPLASLVDALDAGHHDRFGRGLAPKSYAIAASMLQVEHGTGLVGGVLCLRGIYDFNEGNHDLDVAHRDDASVPRFQTVAEREVGPDGREYQAVHVREAYPDAVAGAAGFWDTLYMTFESAYDAIDAEDVPGFVHALKARDYFTETEEKYLAALAPMVNGWMARIDAAGAV